MTGSETPAIGVEEEFFLLQNDSACSTDVELALCNEAMAEQARSIGIDAVAELTRCQVETNSTPSTDLRVIREHIVTTRCTLSALAMANGARILAAGVVPAVTERQGPCSVSASSRYTRLADSFGALAYAESSCGCHVHVEVPDRATAVAIGNYVRPWLPTLLALTANSAVHNGYDTRHASWRSVLWGRWPTAGPPPYLDSEAHYDDVVGTLLAAGTILDERALYWDVRPSGHQPTIEFRVSDVPANGDETALLCGLVRALVLTAEWAHERGEPAPRPEPHRLTAAYDCARRHGLDGIGVDSMGGAPIWSRELVSRLVRHVRAALVYTGDFHYVEHALMRLDHFGNGARRQRRTFTKTLDTAEVMAAALRDTTADRSVVHTAANRSDVDSLHGAVH